MSRKPPRARWFRNADEEAGHWFARRLDSGCEDQSPQDAEFDRWHAAKPEHAVAYGDIERLWLDSAEAARQPEVLAAAREALRPSAPRPPQRRWLVPAVGFAAMAVLLIAGAFVYWPSPRSVPGVRYATATGQQRTVQLADGSRLLLDTDTAVVVNLGPQERHLHLLRGRAQFDVHHDNKRPFVVTAEGGTVTDVGTLFQMRVDKPDVEVLLLQGEVSVSTESDGHSRSASLRAGQRLRYGSDGTIGAVQGVDAAAAEGWTHGKLFVHDWRLPKLLAAMNRYSDTKIEIGDPALRELRISGVFKTGDQQTLLQVLDEGWSIHSERPSTTRVVLSRHAPASGHSSASRR